MNEALEQFPEHVWEGISHDTVQAVMRMRVPGGWVYRVQVYDNGKAGSTALTFVPDPPAEPKPRAKRTWSTA